MVPRSSMVPVFVLLGLCACDSNGSGPEVNVGGSYSYSARLSGVGIDCNANGVTLNLTQRGDEVSGTYSGGTMVCNGSNLSMGSGQVVNGSLLENSLMFDFSPANWDHTGRVYGSRIEGTTTLVLQTNGSSVTLTGGFAAER